MTTPALQRCSLRVTTPALQLSAGRPCSHDSAQHLGGGRWRGLLSLDSFIAPVFVVKVWKEGPLAMIQLRAPPPVCRKSWQRPSLPLLSSKGCSSCP